MEIEESPVFEAAIKQRPVKREQGEYLAYAIVICSVCMLGSVIVVCSYES